MRTYVVANVRKALAALPTRDERLTLRQWIKGFWAAHSSYVFCAEHFRSTDQASKDMMETVAGVMKYMPFDESRHDPMPTLEEFDEALRAHDAGTAPPDQHPVPSRR